jgi:GLPGLI family protein
MKYIFSLIFIALAITVSAQQEAKIEVSYTEYQPNMRTGEKNGTSHQYILLASGDDSKFFSPRTEYLDSLNSTPEGKAKYQEMARSAYLGGKIEDIPRADGSYYVVKSATDNKLYYYDKVGTERFCYEEDTPQLNWVVGDSTKTILGYECFFASVDYHGRKWIAWFTPEIPVAAGPWKLQGVPGLILEATTVDGLYSFIADGIQQTEKIITPIYLINEYEKTDRIKLLKAKRGFMDNPVGAINAQFGGSGVSIRSVKISGGSDSDGKLYMARETIDFIETDY